MAAVSPQAFPIPGTPTGWTPGTNGLVRGDVVMVTETTQEELTQKYAGGKLQGQVDAVAARARRRGVLDARRRTRDTREKSSSAMRARPTPPGARSSA